MGLSLPVKLRLNHKRWPGSWNFRMTTGASFTGTAGRSRACDRLAGLIRCQSASSQLQRFRGLSTVVIASTRMSMFRPAERPPYLLSRAPIFAVTSRALAKQNWPSILIAVSFRSSSCRLDRMAS